MSYVLELTDLQLAFWNALWAPFHPHELSEVPGRGTSVLTYLDKRAIENRLDTVCGPTGWYPTYSVGDGGVMVCALSILVPGPEAKQPAILGNGWHWLTKEDGGGKEDMVKKSGGELIRDDDNSAKSLFTNSLRRAAQDSWGIGRYLYKKGTPLWLNLDNRPLERTPVRIVTPIRHDVNEHGIVVDFSPESRVKTAIKEHVAAGNLPRPLQVSDVVNVLETRPRDVPVTPDPVVPGGTIKPAGPVKGEEQAKAAQAAHAAALGPGGKPAASPINLPRDARSVFNWAKRMEGIFDQRLVQGMTKEAIDKGYPRGMADWTPAQIEDICLSVVCHLIKSPKYNGEFDHLASAVSEHSDKPTPQPTAPSTTGVNLADVRKKIVTSMEALIKYQTGADSTADQVKELFQEVAPQCKNCAGVTGEVPDRLHGLADSVWLGNIQKFLDEQISHARSNMATEEAATSPF